MLSSSSRPKSTSLALMIDPVRSGMVSNEALWKVLLDGDPLPDIQEASLPDIVVMPWWGIDQDLPTPHGVFRQFLDTWEQLRWKWVEVAIGEGEGQVLAGIVKKGLQILDECVNDCGEWRRVLKRGQEQMLEHADALGELYGETDMTQGIFVDVIKGLPVSRDLRS